jgi:hypothetical protein
MEHFFPLFPYYKTFLQSHGGLLFCNFFKKTKVFPKQKNTKHFVLCPSSIHAFGAFSSLSLLRRCLHFGLDFGHSSSLCVPPPFPLWIGAFFFLE